MATMASTPEPQPPTEQPPIPEWLDKLQNESWEAEILISGGAFIGLMSLLPILNAPAEFLYYSTDVDMGVVEAASFMTIFAWWLLTFGFFVHLILRGYWMGLIGLNSAFPKGINKEKLKFTGRFTGIYKEASNMPIILRLDKICGTIFALTFVALFSVVGLILFMVFVGSVFDLTTSQSMSPDLEFFLFGSFLLLFLTVGGFTLADYITFGRLKQVDGFTTIYYPVHTFVSVLTLSIISRRLYYTLVSNISRRYLAMFLILQSAIVVGFLMWRNNSSDVADTMLDRDSAVGNPADGVRTLTISDEVVRGKTLGVSLLHAVRFEDRMFRFWQKEHSDVTDKESFEDLTANEQSALFNQLYEIHIDSQLVTNYQWSFREERLRGSFISSRILEMKCWIDVSKLRAGNHSLVLQRIIDHNGDLLNDEMKAWTVKFRKTFYVESRE